MSPVYNRAKEKSWKGLGKAIMDDIILASASPRRRELMALLGLNFRVLAAGVDENDTHTTSPEELACRLSQEKARAVAGQVSHGIIVAADTIVALGHTLLGKPASVAEARQMLCALRGRQHRVISAITVVRRPEGDEITDWADTLVQMRDYTDEEIEAYIASGDPMDKAGAYAIQHSGFRPVARVEGCYANVVGLPLCHLYRALQSMGVSDARSPVAACRVLTGYACEFYGRLLKE